MKLMLTAILDIWRWYNEKHFQNCIWLIVSSFFRGCHQIHLDTPVYCFGNSCQLLCMQWCPWICTGLVCYRVYSYIPVRSWRFDLFNLSWKIQVHIVMDIFSPKQLNLYVGLWSTHLPSRGLKRSQLGVCYMSITWVSHIVNMLIWNKNLPS